MKKVFIDTLTLMMMDDEKLFKRLEERGLDLKRPISTEEDFGGNWYIQEEQKIMNLKDFLNLQDGLDKMIMKRVEESGRTISNTDLLNSKLLALITEVAEFTNERGSQKYWKQSHEIDEKKALTEFADILFFYLSIANLLGYTAEDIQTAYMEKWRENIRRQKENY